MKNDFNNQKQRILTFIKCKNMSMYAFTRSIGVAHNYITIMKNGFGPEKLERVAEIYPELNMAWLLTGKGSMLTDVNKPPIKIEHSRNAINQVGNFNTINTTKEHVAEITKKTDLIPIVPDELAIETNVDVYKSLCLDADRPSENVQYVTSGTIIPKCVMAYRIRQDAMMPDFRPGDKIAIAEVSKDGDFLNGAAYVLDTKDIGMIFRLVYRRDTYFECRCLNKSSIYEDTNIPIENVYRVFRAVASIRIL